MYRHILKQSNSILPSFAGSVQMNLGIGHHALAMRQPDSGSTNATEPRIKLAGLTLALPPE